MRQLEYHIDDSADGLSVEWFLRGRQGYSRTSIVKLKHLPLGLTLNGRHARSIDIIHTGDVVGVQMLDNTGGGMAAELPVQTLYEDEDYIVFNKPAKMPVHPSPGHRLDTLGNHFAFLCEQKGLTTSPFRPINRLDLDTTGAVVAAKSRHAASLLWKNNTVQKEYLAIVYGTLPDCHGTIDAPIYRLNQSSIQRGVGENGQPAVTHYEVMAQTDCYSLLRIWLDTGRTHQIRVHFSHIGHPLLGDVMYGGKSDITPAQLLHCYKICFENKISDKGVSVIAPIFPEMKRVMRSLGLMDKSLAYGD